MTNLMKFTYLGMIALSGIAMILDLYLESTFDTWKFCTFIWVIIAYLNERLIHERNEVSKSESTSNN